MVLPQDPKCLAPRDACWEAGLPSSHLGALSWPLPKVETTLLCCGDTQEGPWNPWPMPLGWGHGALGHPQGQGLVNTASESHCWWSVGVLLPHPLQACCAALDLCTGRLCSTWIVGGQCGAGRAAAGRSCSPRAGWPSLGLPSVSLFLVQGRSWPLFCFVLIT